MGETLPERWTSTVVLGDGDIAVVRPIRPDDAPALAAFHDRQSAESRYLRYFSPKPHLTADELARFTNVDFVGRAALVVEQHGELVGWGSYERLQHRDDAEVAFMVADAHHGKGIATLLLEHLAAIARWNGITAFTAQTLGDNRAMLAVFTKAGWPVQRRFESGVIDVDFPLDTTERFIDSVERREHRADSLAVARILLPSSIAVIGASDTPRSVGHAIWSTVGRDATRPVFPVNPNHPTVGGVPAYGAITDIADDVGLAIIVVPPGALAATVDACIAKRVRAALVITSVDGTGIDVAALVAHARRNGLRLVGPASMGIASPTPAVALQAALVDVALPPGRVAVSMQSGSLGGSLLRHARTIGLGLSWFVSLGDKCDVSANDLLQFWEDDEATGVIALYTESLGNPRKFARIARRVSTRRPVVAVRTGAALFGQGNDALYRETGVIEVPTVPALLDTARVLATQPLMPNDRVAVLTNSRSPGVLATATLVEAGLDVEAAPRRLDWRASGESYAAVMRAALADPDVGALLVIHAPPVTEAVGGPLAAIEQACAGSDKPVVVVVLGAPDGPATPGSPLPAFAFPEQAAAALARVAAYSRWRRTEAVDVDETPDRIDPPAAAGVLAGAVDRGTLDVGEVRAVLAAYGVAMPPTQVVAAAGAGRAADEIGYPVAVKAVHRHLGRSARAGVALDLGDREAVEDAVAIMRASLGADAAEVQVQQMVPPGADLRVRAVLDERIGPIVSAGIGGVQADAIADESSRIAPMSHAVARALLDETRAAAMLDGHRLELVADTVARVAQLASDHGEIVELDLNPVIVTESGCWVVDARTILRRPPRPQPAVRRLET